MVRRLSETTPTIIATVILLRIIVHCVIFAYSYSIKDDDYDVTVAFDNNNGYLPPHNPQWEPRYNMHDSLITMQVNLTGLSSPNRGAQFGIVSYDWSNMKKIWAAGKPMICEELMVQQAIETKRAANELNMNPKVFVYRNIVKALPWFTSVRKKLDNPSYSGFFLKFNPSLESYHVPSCAIENQTHCSIYYHDQLQTPQVPTTQNPYPDGNCTNNRCDCGIHPCGEYLFDHRNGTMLREWIINEIILGSTAIGHPDIDGLFLDDFWCSNLLCNSSNNAILGCPCNDPVQGPTEIDRYSQIDIGLSDEDIANITVQWNITMGYAQRAILYHHAYTWSLISGQNNANAWPQFLSSNSKQCIASCRYACQPNSIWQQQTNLFGFTITNGTVLSQLEQDLSYFLLVRGPYAYAGWGLWGMTWPFQSDPNYHGTMPPSIDGVPLPSSFDIDYGIPEEVCYETKHDGGIFRRRWSKSLVELDCNTFVGKIFLNEMYNTVSTSSI
jgi:hypothetical protein